jgi:hypothetical protein
MLDRHEESVRAEIERSQLLAPDWDLSTDAFLDRRLAELGRFLVERLGYGITSASATIER